MKKLILVFAVLILMITPLMALDFTVGPKVTMGDYSFRGELEGADNNLSASFSGGVFFDAQFNQMLGIQVEGFYNYMTQRMGGVSGSSADWIQYMLSAISIPVYLRANFDLGGVGMYVLAGPRFDILFGNFKMKDSLGDEVDYSYSDMDVNTFLTGLAIGAGVTVPAGSGKLEIGVGYSTEFTEFADSSDVYMYGLELQVGYGFQL